MLGLKACSSTHGFNLIVFRENFQELQKCEKVRVENLLFAISHLCIKTLFLKD